MLEIEAANSGKVLVIGHRGALGYAPENTMASFEVGLQLGVDLIELDIHMSRDGHLVVMHDGEVTRTTDGSGRISDMTLAEIARLDAGCKFDERFRGQRVPLLSEVMAWARGRIPLVIEIKGDPEVSPGIEEKLIDLVHQHRILDEVIVISFHHTAVKRAKELEPGLATGILYSGRLVDTTGAARAARADSVRPQWSYWTRELVDEVHAAGLTASAWVVNSEARAELLVNMGIDSIGSDYPDRLCTYLERAGRRWPAAR